jgi:glucose-6-phosphate isomerase
LAIGFDNFDELLSGANEMDDHFKTADFDQNMPVVLALISIWYNNFLGGERSVDSLYAISSKTGSLFTQGTMESNGKSVGRDGNLLLQTGTIIWENLELMHNMLQLIHQGTS